jgi:hypothetical protein
MTNEHNATAPRYIRRKDILDANLGEGETVLLSPASGSYYGLDGPGAAIWNAFQDAHTISEICDLLMREFEVTREECEADATAFVEQLLAAGLIVETST